MRSLAPLFLASLAAAQGSELHQREAEYYDVDHLVPPEGERLEVGGIDFLPDGRLALSTRRGQVWLVENPLAPDPAQARFTLFAEGLWEGLGLKVIDGAIHVLQRGELSRLADDDGDGVCDRVETVCDAWGLSENYHEFAYGLPVDAQGNFYLALNVSFFSPKWWHGKAPVPWRGWALEVSPGGALTPIASGLRSPCGVSLSPAGELFVTDNQGDWMPASPIFHVVPGGFYGHPASLDWTDEYRATSTHASDTIPPARAASDRRPAAIWLPYRWSRSPGNMAWDETGGLFGPFEHQFFLAELTNGMVLRGDMEKVQGEYQGWVTPFRTRVGSAVRALFASDGTLFVGLTNRGWGGQSPADGVARVRWTGRTPLEIARVKLAAVHAADRSRGAGPGARGGTFLIDFTKPLTRDNPLTRANVQVVQYAYDYWWEYGSPERSLTELAALPSIPGDGERLVVVVPELEPGKVARVKLSGLSAADGTPLLHEEFAYTINQFPLGTPTSERIARLVPPPPARESGDEGWLFLTYTDALGRWDSSGWVLADVELDPDDPRRFRTMEGTGAILNVGPDATDFVGKEAFGDCKVHLLFQLPDGGSSAVYVMGRYAVALSALEHGSALTSEDCGALLRGASWPGRAPDFEGFRGSGQWHDLDLEFQAPRFDASGKKLENARFLRVRIDDTLLHENVELPEPALGALGADEVSAGPLVLRGTDTQVAFADVRVFPKVAPLEPEGWTPLFTLDMGPEELEAWQVAVSDTPVTAPEPAPGAEDVAGAEADAAPAAEEAAEGRDEPAGWRVEDGVIVGSGPTSHLFSPRGDYRDFELRGRFKISDGGNSGLYFRATYGPGWPAGYEAQINATFADPQKTGSLYGLVQNGTTLVPPDTWFDYFVRCVDEPGGTYVTIRVNGVTFVDFVDPERRHASGHVALQQHHVGSVIEAKDLWIREL